jgi:hypothetical protein
VVLRGHERVRLRLGIDGCRCLIPMAAVGVEALERVGRASVKRKEPAGTIRFFVAVAPLTVCVLSAYYLLGMPNWLSILGGCSAAYLISSAISRRFRLAPPARTDDERLKVTPLGRWILIDWFVVLVAHFGGRYRWYLSVGGAPIVTVVFVLFELRNRSQAREWLAHDPKAL